MTPTPKYELIQDRLGRSLDTELRSWQSEGMSAPAMARRILLETQVVVSAETIRVWLRELNGAAA